MAAHLAYAPTTNNQFYDRHPRPPPSPPMEDTRCSLPSISNLLGLADAGSPTTDPSPTSYRGSPQSEVPLSYPHAQSRRESGGVGSRPGSRHSGVFQHRRGLPPTPPLSTDNTYDSYNSPSSKARGHFPFEPSSSSRYHETTPPLESDMHRQSIPGPSRPPQLSIPVPPRHQLAPTAAAPQAAGQGYYAAPVHAVVMGPGQMPPHYSQQALPNAFPPHPMQVQDNQHLWQHHHYLHPSQSSVYPQSQDKYLCPTCNKAFSRPSSLRIHSHSHTGEKPYKCAHPGCGKAFSVRSNMKRHERGCHSMGPMGTRPMV